MGGFWRSLFGNNLDAELAAIRKARGIENYIPPKRDLKSKLEAIRKARGDEPRKSAIHKALDDFNKYLQDDLQFSHSENLLDAVEENLENLTAQKILDSQDNRFLEAYSVLEKVLNKATHLDLKRLSDVILRENICCINEIDDLLSIVIEEIHQERKLKDSEEFQFRLAMLKRDLKIDLEKLLKPESDQL